MRRPFPFVIAVIAALCVVSVSAQKGPKPKKPKKKDLVAELRVSTETAPPGAITQIKIELTEPKPVSTGSFEFLDDFGDLEGIALFSPADDTYGLAWLGGGGGLRIITTSALAGFGTEPDYPILTLAVRVPDVPLGSLLPVRLDPGVLEVLDPDGVAYDASAKDGSITVMPAVGVEDVVPGSDGVPAGVPVTLLGRDFTENTRVDVNEANIDEAVLVSEARIDLFFEDPTVMQGRRIRVRDKSDRSTYYSYQRTQRADLSDFPDLNFVEPLFPAAGATSATVEFPEAGGNVLALAVSNTHLAPVPVTISRDCGGPPAISSLVALPSASHVVLHMTDLFGSPNIGSCSVTVEGGDTLHTMGFVADRTLTTVQLLPPQ